MTKEKLTSVCNPKRMIDMENHSKKEKKIWNGENYNSRGYVLKEMMKIRKALCQKKGMRKFILESGSAPSSTIQYMGEYIKQSSLFLQWEL